MFWEPIQQTSVNLARRDSLAVSPLPGGACLQWFASRRDLSLSNTAENNIRRTLNLWTHSPLEPRMHISIS